MLMVEAMSHAAVVPFVASTPIRKGMRGRGESERGEGEGGGEERREERGEKHRGGQP